jgi:two-component system NtrC family response regulator
MALDRLLIVGNVQTLRELVGENLSVPGFQANYVLTTDEAIEHLEREPVSIVFADLDTPAAQGLELLRRIRSGFPHVPVVVFSGSGSINAAVSAIKAGACDYLAAPLNAAELNTLIHGALAGRAADRKDDQPHREIVPVMPRSSSLREVLATATRVASTDATVLILGETGTGKELMARAIHKWSLRRGRPFVTVSCGSIPRELLESELFGYTKGSFTGAIAPKKGKVEIADKGTLFLDEIGEMPLGLQVRILRLLQEREIEKIGAPAPSKVDVRIIAATHRNLEIMVEKGTFREDLYYRLLVVPIRLPPLRDRACDIPDLVAHFFEEYKKKHNRGDLSLPDDLLSYFSNYRWPGNIRQLENAIERIVLLASGSQVDLEVLPDFLKGATSPLDLILQDLPDAGLDIGAVERQLIIKALHKSGGNHTRAAHFLNMSRRAFTYRLKRFGLESSARVKSRTSAAD